MRTRKRTGTIQQVQANAEPRVNDPSVPLVAKALEDMGPAELLAEYNRVSLTKRRAKFKTTAAAIEAIRAAQQTAPVVPAEPEPVERPADAKRDPNKVVARKANVMIKVLGGENPYRPGSNASDHYDKMQGGISVRQYLSKFPQKEQRVARQWLYNAIKAKHVKTVETE